MKKLVFVLSIAVALVACKKEETKKDEANNTYVPKGNFVFKLDGKQYDLNAKLKNPSPGIWLISWDSTDMSSVSYINLTITSNLPKTYNLVDSFTTEAAAQFNFSTVTIGSPRKDYISTSGTFNLTDNSDNKWSAKFSGKVKDKESGTEGVITDGQVIAIPLTN